MSLSDTLDRPETGPFAAALRRARAARRMSQLDLALTCDVSARHLSFLESGRARPSREMVLQLAHGLLLPLGSQNALLQAAGFAPVFPASPLDSAALGPFRAVLDEMIARHSPYPALLCDRHWTILDANPTARALLTPLRQVVAAQDFLAGDEPDYADYAVFGAFQWARCASPFRLLEADDPVFAWRERMLDLFGGLARDVPAFE